MGEVYESALSPAAGTGAGQFGRLSLVQSA